MKGIVCTLLAVMCLTFAVAASAQSVDRPVLSLTRLNLGIGANYAWFNSVDPAGPQMPFKHEWQAGLYGAYNLISPPANAKGTTLSLIGASLYGVDNKAFTSFVGLRVGIFDGSRQ